MKLKYQWKQLITAGGFPPKSDCELPRTHPGNGDFTSKLKKGVGGGEEILGRRGNPTAGVHPACAVSASKM